MWPDCFKIRGIKMEKKLKFFDHLFFSTCKHNTTSLIGAQNLDFFKKSLLAKITPPDLNATWLHKCYIQIFSYGWRNGKIILKASISNNT